MDGVNKSSRSQFVDLQSVSQSASLHHHHHRSHRLYHHQQQHTALAVPKQVNDKKLIRKSIVEIRRSAILDKIAAIEVEQQPQRVYTQ